MAVAQTNLIDAPDDVNQVVTGPPTPLSKPQAKPQPDAVPTPKSKPDLAPTQAMVSYKQFAETMLGRISADNAEAQKSTPPPVPEELRQPMPPSQVTSPIQQWGSWAMMFAALGSLMTRTPMTTALNAAAGVMNAYRKGDQDAFNFQYQQWKASNDYALKLYDFQSKHYDAAMKLLETDQNAAMKEWEIAAKVMGDGPILQLLQEGKYLEAARVNIDRERAAAEIPEHIEKTQVMKEQADNYFGVLAAQRGVEQAKAATGLAPAAKAAAISKAQDALMAANARVSTFNNAYKGKDASASTVFDDDAIQAAAGMIENGIPAQTAMPGWGTSATNARVKATGVAVRNYMKHHPGATAADAGGAIAVAQANYAGAKSSITQLDKMIGASDQAVRQLDYNVEQASKAMERLGSGDISPVINAMANGVAEWHGDPAYYDTFFFMHAAAVESARILSGGQASIAQLNQSAADEAKHWANENLTPDSWNDGVGPAMVAEGHQRLDTYQLARDSMSRQAVGQKPLPIPTPQLHKYHVGDVVHARDGKAYRVKALNPAKPDSPFIEPVNPQ